MPEPPAHQRPTVQSGKRNTRLLDQWGELLRKNGSVTVEAPDDPKAVTSIRERLYTAAKRQCLKVSVRVKDGSIVATVKA